MTTELAQYASQTAHQQIKAWRPEAKQELKAAICQMIIQKLNITKPEAISQVRTNYDHLLETFGYHSLEKLISVFDLYVDNKLSVEPIPNYYDRILIGKILKAYTEYRRTLTRPENRPDEEAMKREHDRQQVLGAAEHIVRGGGLKLEYSWIYEYMEAQDLKPWNEYVEQWKPAAWKYAQAERERRNMNWDKDQLIAFSKITLFAKFVERIDNLGIDLKALIR